MTLLQLGHFRNRHRYRHHLRERYTGVCDNPTHASCNAAIHIQSSKNISLKDNHVDLTQQGAACKKTVNLEEDNELSSKKVE
jgi:hypothetical protein